MQMIQCKCQSCGSELNLDLDNLQAYCPACGSKLLIDMDMLGQIMIEREKTNRYKVEKEAEVEIGKINAKKSTISDLMFFLPIICFMLFIIILFVILGYFGLLND